MSSKDQWGVQPQQGVSYGAGPNPGYSPNYAPSPSVPYQTNGYEADQKSPYEGDRFKPKKRINDPIFLVFFVLQVCHIVPSVLEDQVSTVFIYVHNNSCWDLRASLVSYYQSGSLRVVLEEAWDVARQGPP